MAGCEGMTRRLQQYKGELPASQIAAGMNAAAKNAERLCLDARLLLDNGRLPSSVSLAVLSIEESGKLGILRSLPLARDQEELKATWRDYRTHTSKNEMWPLIDLLRQGARRLRDFRPLFIEEADHPTLLNNLKQMALYTDCLGQGHWSIPDEVIDENLARSIVQVAELLVPNREITEREIELWILHMKPVWKERMELMEAAVAEWHRQMCAEGLSDDDPDAMENFILWGLDSSRDD